MRSIPNKLGAGQRPPHWEIIAGVITVTCPNHHISILDRTIHLVDTNGEIKPAVECPRQGCNFTDWVMLQNWSPEVDQLKMLTFVVTREPFTDFFTIHLVDPKTGKPYNPPQSEELDVDETYEWFRLRGADMTLLEKALDHVWNFYKGSFTFTNYIEPAAKNAATKPNID